MLEKYSPDAANAQYARENEGKRVVCTKTLYNYIRDGLFYGLGEEALPRGSAGKDMPSVTAGPP